MERRACIGIIKQFLEIMSGFRIFLPQNTTENEMDIGMITGRLYKKEEG